MAEIAALLGVVVAGIVTLVGTLLARKIGLELTAEREARIEHFARQAAKFAEEQAAALLSKRTMTGAEKLEMAAAYLQQKAPSLSSDAAKLAVTAALPDVGLGAGARLGNAQAGAPQPAPPLPPQ